MTCDVYLIARTKEEVSKISDSTKEFIKKELDMGLTVSIAFELTILLCH